MYRLAFVIAFGLGTLAAQPLENFRVEATASAWHTRVSGELQSGILPIDLRSDLNLDDSFNFVGRLVLKPGRRHRFVIDGGPYESTGSNRLTRSISYNGQLYRVSDVIDSKASLTSIFGGYQFDVISRDQGHLGFLAGGVYLDAEGTIRSGTTGFSATRTYQLGLPLAGMEFRAFLIPGSRLLNVNAEVRGMQFGDNGHYVRATPAVGLSFGIFTLQAGFIFLDAEIHENRSAGIRTGIALRMTGPVFGIQIRDR
jgi:hypothetical protein